MNEAYKGRKYPTAKHKEYARYVNYLLMKENPKKPPKGKKAAHYQWGMSSDNSDTDNPTKVFQDILTKFYGMKDDKEIEFIILEKKKVRKGEEFIGFHVMGRKSLIKYLEGLVETLKDDENG